MALCWESISVTERLMHVLDAALPRSHSFSVVGRCFCLDEVILCGKSPRAIIRYICWTFWVSAISLEPLSQVSWCKDALCCGHPSRRKSADYQQRQIAGNPSSMTAIPAVFSASFGAFVPSDGPKRVRVGLCLLHFAQDKFVLVFSATKGQRSVFSAGLWRQSMLLDSSWIAAEPQRRAYAVLIRDLRDRRSITRKLYRCSSVSDVSVCV